jgi:hypothetical protein
LLIHAPSGAGKSSLLRAGLWRRVGTQLSRRSRSSGRDRACSAMRNGASSRAGQA